MTTQLERASPPASSRPRRPGWDLIALAALLAAGGLFVAIDKPSILTGGFSSPRAVAVTVGTGIVTLAIVVLAQRRIPNAATRFVVMLLPIAVAAWFLVVPAYRTTTADEALPGTVAGDQGTADAEAPADAGEGAATDAAPAVGGAAEEPADTAEQPTGTAEQPTGTAEQPAGPPPAPAPAPAAPAEPVEVASGPLSGLTGHDATGTVATYLLADGSRAIRFQDVAIEPGPDYRVYLVPGADQTDPVEGSVDLGGLTATNGSFNYTVPADFDATQPFTVLIWCRAFAVEIGAATQLPTA